MDAMSSQITSLTIVYSTVYSDADRRKHQSSASLAFVRGIHRWPVNSPHKWTVTRKMFPFDDVIMQCVAVIWQRHSSHTVPAQTAMANQPINFLSLQHFQFAMKIIWSPNCLVFYLTVAQGEAACIPFSFQHPLGPPPPYSEHPPLPFNPAFIPPYAAHNWSSDYAGNATFMSAPELTAMSQWPIPERNRTNSESVAYPFSSEQQEHDTRVRNGPEYRRSQSESYNKRGKTWVYLFFSTVSS